MKTLMPAAFSATWLGLHLSGNCQVESFIFAGSSQASMQRASSLGRVRGFHTGHASRDTGTVCRMNSSAAEDRPTKGFGQPQPSGKTSSKKAKKAEQGTAGNAEEDKGTGNRNLYLQFTCNRCDGVSQYMINRSAYEDGIVICTCQTCKVKHLLADNLKKMDIPAFGNNIEEYMQSVGSPDEVTKGTAPGLTKDVLDKFTVSVGDDGVLNLSPKSDAAS